MSCTSIQESQRNLCLVLQYKRVSVTCALYFNARESVYPMSCTTIQEKQGNLRLVLHDKTVSVNCVWSFNKRVSLYPVSYTSIQKSECNLYLVFCRSVSSEMKSAEILALYDLLAGSNNTQNFISYITNKRRIGHGVETSPFVLRTN